IAAGILAASSPAAWFDAVVAYRGQGDSFFTGSPLHRLHLFVGSLPAAAAGLGVLVLFAVYGWSRSHLLLRLSLGAALIAVLGGGNFHPHYYIQLGPALAAVGGAGIARLRSRRVAAFAVAAAVLAAAAITGTVASASTAKQAQLIWPHDAHLRWDAGV